jgi:hypothetical protein
VRVRNQIDRVQGQGRPGHPGSGVIIAGLIGFSLFAISRR